jgi:hypothetical protein
MFSSIIIQLPIFLYILSGANYEDVTWQKTVMKNIGLDFSRS